MEKTAKEILKKHKGVNYIPDANTIKAMEEYASQFQKPELPSFPEGMDNQKGLPTDDEIRLKSIDEYPEHSDIKYLAETQLKRRKFVHGAKWMRSQAERGVKELKPLSEITDEDAVEISNICENESERWTKVQFGRQKAFEIENEISLTTWGGNEYPYETDSLSAMTVIKVYKYLQSKGYKI